MIFSKRVEEDGQPMRHAPTASVPPALPNQTGAPKRSVVDAWLCITGDLEGDGELEIEGRIVGNVRCKHLVVGAKGSIEGNIQAEQAVIRGEVKGTIRADYVILQAGARVDSEIFHKELAVESGAVFEGASRPRKDPVGELKSKAAEMKAADARAAAQAARKAASQTANAPYTPPSLSNSHSPYTSSSANLPSMEIDSMSAEIEAQHAEMDNGMTTADATTQKKPSNGTSRQVSAERQRLRASIG